MCQIPLSFLKTFDIKIFIFNGVQYFAVVFALIKAMPIMRQLFMSVVGSAVLVSRSLLHVENDFFAKNRSFARFQNMKWRSKLTS